MPLYVESISKHLRHRNIYFFILLTSHFYNKNLQLQILCLKVMFSFNKNVTPKEKKTKANVYGILFDSSTLTVAKLVWIFNYPYHVLDLI